MSHAHACPCPTAASRSLVPQVQELQSTPRMAALGHSLPQSPHSSNGDGGELRGGNQQVWQLRAQLEAAQKVQPYRHSLDLLAQGSRGLALQVPPSACPTLANHSALLCIGGRLRGVLGHVAGCGTMTGRAAGGFLLTQACVLVVCIGSYHRR